MSKQTTLMQSWGAAAREETKKKLPVTDEVITIDEDDEDDDVLLARAMEESLKEPQPSTSVQYSAASINTALKTGLFHQIGKTGTNAEIPGPSEAPDKAADANFDLGFDEEDDVDDATLAHMVSAPVPYIEELAGFDKAAGRLWIYPTNYPVRDYQFNIVQSALLKNTLVVLPTGLGKTFIAAVVMYNFYRWYPQAKIVFMAPTKPLVAQQIEACYNIMGIPQEHTAEMTGMMVEMLIFLNKIFCVVSA